MRARKSYALIVSAWAMAAAMPTGWAVEALPGTGCAPGGCMELAQLRNETGIRPISPARAEAPKPIGPPPAPRPALPEPALRIEPVFKSYLYAVFFTYGSARIGPNGQATVERLAAEAKGADEIVLTGRTDRSGDAKRNEELARRRVDAVRMAMLSKGTSDDAVKVRIDTAESGQIAPGTWNPAIPRAQHLRARRVDIHIQRKEAPKP